MPHSGFRVVFGDVLDNPRQILGGCLGPSDAHHGRHSGQQDSLNAVHDFRVVQQCASTDVGSAFLDRFDESGILFQHPIDGFPNKSRGLFTQAGRNVAKARFLIR